MLWCKQNYLVLKHLITPRGNPSLIKLSFFYSFISRQTTTSICCMGLCRWICPQNSMALGGWCLSITIFQGISMLYHMSVLHSLLWPMVFWHVCIYSIHTDIPIYKTNIQYFLHLFFHGRIFGSFQSFGYSSYCCHKDLQICISLNAYF